MLNPLRLEQKNPSEEDSSDSGSELGLEPETDRFGFFLTDGSADGVRKAGPSPALVRQREAKWINIIDQWDRLLLKKTNKVKVQCQKGIPPSLRAKCWSLLSGATDRMKQQKDLYKLLDSQPALKHWEDVIERDLDRQFPFHEMFVSKDGHGQRNLFQVLKTFTQFKPEEGYCQAQGPVAAVLLMNMPVEEAFWCLVQICEQYLPGYYSPLLEGVLFDAAILTWVLKRSCPAAHKHLQRHGVEPLMFATDWLMCLFTRHLPFNTLLRVWDLFFCYGVRVLLQVAAVLVHRVLGREDQRKQCCGQMETLQRLRGIREEIKDEEDDFIAEVLAVPLSARDLQRQTEKELEKWQKERPSSTFDPRGRCQGYQMAWAIVQQSMEECERKGREKGNLSVPLFRSASTLSLSPSKWRKGVKGNSGEWKSGVKVVRHLSMGAKEDWQSWANLNVKKVEDLQEDDFVLIEKKKQSETGLKRETQQTELLEESENQQTEVQNVGNVPEINIDLQTEQLKENEEKEVSESTTPTGSQEENLDSNLPLTGDDIAASQQGERQSFLSKVPCQKADENDTEVDDLNKETQIIDFAAETDINVKKINTNANEQPSVDIDKNQENNNLHCIKSLKQLALEAVRTPDSKSEDEGKHIKHTEDTIERDTQQQNTETDKYLEKHSFAECQCTESLTGIEMKESHTQAVIETRELTAQDNIEDLTTSNMESGHTDLKQHQTDTEKEVLSQGLSEGIQPETQDIPDKEILVIESTVTDVNNLTEQTMVVDFPKSTNSCDHTEETNEDLHKQQSSIENTDVNLNTEAVGVAISTSEQCALERNIPTNVCQAAEENTSSTSHQIEDAFTGNNQQYSYRSSGDFRVRKSSSSRESRLARRLSEDLFTTPQRSNHPDEAEQTFPSLTADATEEAATHKEKQPCNPPKRFGLFSRLKEQPKKNKNQGKPKMQVPKILIQDFSDEREMGKVVTVEVDDKLTSRERRRLRREQKRKDKEEERQRKKDKELEKKERRAQTKGKSVQVQSEKAEPQLGNAKSQSTSYAYF